MKHSEIGMDLAKQVFQLRSVDAETGEVERTKLLQDEVLSHFARRPPALVAIEACGSAHWWARKLVKLGHDVRLLPSRNVPPSCCATRSMRPTRAPSGRRCSNPTCNSWQ